METRQQILEIGSEFLSLFEEAIAHANNASSSASLYDSIDTLTERFPELNNKLSFLLDPLRTSYNQLAQKNAPINQDIINQAVCNMLKKLKFASNRTIDAKVMTHRIRTLKREIDEECSLLPCEAELEHLTDRTNPRSTATNLSFIGTQLISELANYDVITTNNSTYEKAGRLSRALSNLVNNQLAQALDDESQKKCLAMWINVLVQSNKIKKIFTP